MADSFTSIHDVQVHKAKGGKGDAAELQLPPDAVMRELDPQELNRMFVHRYVSQQGSLSTLGQPSPISSVAKAPMPSQPPCASRKTLKTGLDTVD